MPRHSIFEITDKPLHVNGRVLHISKPYSKQDYQKQTVLTDDIFTYVSFFYSTHQKAMRFLNTANKEKYGNSNQFHYKFYWDQAEIFYNASKCMPLESAPVAEYYCMLNAVKSYISFISNSADDFVPQFKTHGIMEDNSDFGENLSTISIVHKQQGVFPLFSNYLDENFENMWPSGKDNPKTLKGLFYNLPFVHRAYSMTYSTKNRKVDELFLPIVADDPPKLYKGNDGKAYVIINLEKKPFLSNAQTIPSNIFSTISRDFDILNGRGFKLISKQGAKWNSNGSISGEIKELTENCRKDFVYIKSPRRLWYLKRYDLNNENILNLNTMTINMAAMHRISEIARYKPEQLRRLMESKENWLLHEFITKSLDQFIDKLAAQITHQEIMCTGYK